MGYDILILVAGFTGGIVRGLVGFIKHQFSYKKVEFNIRYFLGMMIVSGIVGFLSSLAAKESGIIAINFSPAFSFVAGYAGGDFLDNMYKLVFKKPEVYKVP